MIDGREKRESRDGCCHQQPQPHKTACTALGDSEEEGKGVIKEGMGGREREIEIWGREGGNREGRDRGESVKEGRKVRERIEKEETGERE